MEKSITINRINEIIDKEIEFAANINPQMAFGMSQIKMLLNKEAENNE